MDSHVSDVLPFKGNTSPNCGKQARLPADSTRTGQLRKLAVCDTEEVYTDGSVSVVNPVTDVPGTDLTGLVQAV